jgi:hypothetical protein
MSRTEHSKTDVELATMKARRRMEDARRRERKALERVRRTGNPEHRKAYIDLTGKAMSAESAYHAVARGKVDKGWELIRKHNGVIRFHREFGLASSVDIEPQATTWLAVLTIDRIVQQVSRGHLTPFAACAAIEADAGIPHKDLPAIPEEVHHV